MQTEPRAPATELLAAARGGDEDAYASLIGAHRSELLAHCYRMLASLPDAEDAMQETLLRAWRGLPRFEGRSSFRSWLYRIATNVCLKVIERRPKRVLPPDYGPAAAPRSGPGEPLAEAGWIDPFPDVLQGVEDGRASPESRYERRESIELAFTAALQHLPARQRAVLILREVLRWQATEVAELLETSVASVNSALQRARATLAARDTSSATSVTDPEQQALLVRYVDAFERYDITRLVTLLHDDAVMSMPPYDLWLRGPVEMGRWFLGQGCGCQGSRLVPTAANGCAAFGSYRPDGTGGYRPFALQVIEISGDRIAGHHNFLDTTLFAAFGLPAQL
jgi:RNA polymerase sigma-70 factor (ECF subfamily)